MQRFIRRLWKDPVVSNAIAGCLVVLASRRYFVQYLHSSLPCLAVAAAWTAAAYFAFAKSKSIIPEVGSIPRFPLWARRVAGAAVIVIPMAAATLFLLSFRITQPPTGIVRVAVAQFSGADPERHRITDVILEELRQEFRSFPEVVIQGLEGIPGVTNAQSAREAAREEGRRRGANIVISGWYNQSKVVVYFDVTEHRAPPFCKEPNPNILPLDALESFDVSAPLQDSMHRTVLLIAGIARMQAKDNGSAIDRLTRVIASGGPNPSRAESAFAHYCRALCNYHQHNYQAAVEDATAVAQLYPGVAPVYLLRGAAYSELRAGSLALADFNTALRLDPGNACAEENRGLIYLSIGSPQLALADFDDAVKRHLTDEALPVSRAKALLALGQHSSAIADLRAAIPRLKTSEQLGSAYVLLSEAYGESGQYKEALAAAERGLRAHVGGSELDARAVALVHMRQFDRALVDFGRAIELEQSPRGKAEIYANRGQFNFERNDLPSAIRDLTTAIQLDGALGRAYNLRGLAEERSGDPHSAIEDLAKVTTFARDRSLPEDYSKLGRALARAGDTESALKDYAEAIARGSKLAYGNRARLEFRQKSYAGAIEDLTAALAINAADIKEPEIAQGVKAGAKELLRLRASAHFELGHLDLALQDVETLLEDDENAADLHNIRGLILLRKGDKNAALRDWEYVLSVQPHDFTALANRAWLHLTNGKSEQAVRDTTSALETAPRESQGAIYDTRALANLNLGKSFEAIADCKEAISLQSDLWHSHYACGIAYERTGERSRAVSYLRAVLAHRSSMKDPGDGAMIAEAERELATLTGPKR
jgi:tetratricopeptide (TPR) repeat protein